METYILSITVMTGIVIPVLALLAFWQKKRNDRQDEEKQGRWCLGLVNTGTGQYLQKDFFGAVVLGRDTGIPEPETMLFLSFDPTISRQQCRILIIKDEAWIENLSRVNGTVLNGTLLDTPRKISQGDRLLLSHQEYLVWLLEPR